MHPPSASGRGSPPGKAQRDTLVAKLGHQRRDRSLRLRRVLPLCEHDPGRGEELPDAGHLRDFGLTDAGEIAAEQPEQDRRVELGLVVEHEHARSRLRQMFPAADDVDLDARERETDPIAKRHGVPGEYPWLPAGERGDCTNAEHAEHRRVVGGRAGHRHGGRLLWPGDLVQHRPVTGLRLGAQVRLRSDRDRVADGLEDRDLLVPLA